MYRLKKCAALHSYLTLRLVCEIMVAKNEVIISDLQNGMVKLSPHPPCE